MEIHFQISEIRQIMDFSLSFSPILIVKRRLPGNGATWWESSILPIRTKAAENLRHKLPWPPPWFYEIKLWIPRTFWFLKSSHSLTENVLSISETCHTWFKCGINISFSFIVQKIQPIKYPVISLSTLSRELKILIL